MKTTFCLSRNFSILLVVLFSGVLLFSSCSQKTGCPSNGKNVGAEKLLNDQKPPKAKKFRA